MSSIQGVASEIGSAANERNGGIKVGSNRTERTFFWRSEVIHRLALRKALKILIRFDQLGEGSDVHLILDMLGFTWPETLVEIFCNKLLGYF